MPEIALLQGIWALNVVRERTPEHQAAARAFKGLYSTYQRSRDLISVGAYEVGSDAKIDLAIDAMPQLDAYLKQDYRHCLDLQQSLGDLMSLFPQDPQAGVDLQ